MVLSSHNLTNYSWDLFNEIFYELGLGLSNMEI